MVEMGGVSSVESGFRLFCKTTPKSLHAARRTLYAVKKHVD
jgi:hypothetical protein